MRQLTIELSRPRAGIRNVGRGEAGLSTGAGCPAEPCRAGDKCGVRPVREFLVTAGGAVSIETALALSVLVIVLAIVVGIFDALWTNDRYRVAAYVAAHDVALNPESWSDTPRARAIACDAIEAELSFSGEFDCDASVSYSVFAGLSPADLAADTIPDQQDRTGDMVMVEIRWNKWPARLGGGLLDWSAVGVARGEVDGR